MLNNASAFSQFIPAVITMARHMGDDDSTLNIIKDRLSPSNDKALNVRSLQMFTILLRQIKTDTRDYANVLNQYDSILDGTKKEILGLRKDTVIRHIFRDSVLKASFKPQLQQLRLKWKKADSLIKYVNVLIDNTLALSSDNLITTTELQLQAEGQQKLGRGRGGEDWQHPGHLRQRPRPGNGARRRAGPGFQGQQDRSDHHLLESHRDHHRTGPQAGGAVQARGLDDSSRRARPQHCQGVRTSAVRSRGPESGRKQERRQRSRVAYTDSDFEPLGQLQSVRRAAERGD